MSTTRSEGWGLAVDRAGGSRQNDFLLSETAAGVERESLPTTDENDNSLVLFVVSLFGVNNSKGEAINGDALLVRPRGTAESALLSAVLGCAPNQVAKLVAGSGTWAVREIAEIDGHRVRFDVI